MRKIAILFLLASSFALGQSGVHMGAVPFAAPIRGGIAFTLTAGGPGSGACYIGTSGFCWTAGGTFVLHKVGTNGLCYSTCDVQGLVGAVSNVALATGCTEISFRVSGVTLKVGGFTAYNRNAWYSQTSCNSPSGFLGGGTLFVYQ